MKNHTEVFSSINSSLQKKKKKKTTALLKIESNDNYSTLELCRHIEQEGYLSTTHHRYSGIRPKEHEIGTKCTPTHCIISSTKASPNNNSNFRNLYIFSVLISFSFETQCIYKRTMLLENVKEIC